LIALLALSVLQVVISLSISMSLSCSLIRKEFSYSYRPNAVSRSTYIELLLAVVGLYFFGEAMLYLLEGELI